MIAVVSRFLLLVLIAILPVAPLLAQSKVEPPETTAQVVTDVLHGVPIDDPYRWLEDQQSPETRAWIADQQRYSRQAMPNLEMQREIARQLEDLLGVESLDVPLVRGDRYFFTKRLADQDSAVIAMRDGDSGEDQLLVDPRSLSDDGSMSVSILDVSHDGTLLVYSIRAGGEDEFAVRVLSVDDRRHLADALPRARYFEVILSSDNALLYYTHHTPEGSRVYRHAIGRDVANDELIFGESYGPGQLIFSSLSSDGRYLFLHVIHGSSAQKSDIYFQDLVEGGPLQILMNDIDARFSGHVAGQRFFMLTNWEAPNGRILVVDLTKPQRENWEEIIPQSDAVIEGFQLAGGRLCVNFLQQVSSYVRIFEPDGHFVRELNFPSTGTVSHMVGHWEQPTIYLSFDSFDVPPTVFAHQVQSGEQHIWFREDISFDRDQFEVKQVWYESKDGTPVPMFIVHAKGIKLDGNNPTLLTGYGGFNFSSKARFSPRALMWIQHGGVYALPNLRGGGEFGEKWHEAGMLANRQNVFDDFIAAAEWLIAQGYTNPSRLGIYGSSAGGLLVGGAMTQHPELFRAVICTYPLLDMVRYHLFLLAHLWIPEYGSSQDAEQFKALYAYSPYHHIRDGTDYPATLLITGDADTRVAPLHARKFAARLQAATTSGLPVVLHYDTKLGHSGGRSASKSKTIEELSLVLAFLFDQLGVDCPTTSLSSVGDSAKDQLHALLDAEWERTLRDDPLLASRLGDPRYNDHWPDRSLQAIERRHELDRQVLDKLNSIAYSELSESDRINFQLFRHKFDEQVASFPYGRHLRPLDQRGGIQDASSMADALSFTNLGDYQDWIARLHSFPNYMQQTMDLMRAGIHAGIVHPKVVMRRIPEQIEQQIVDDPVRSLFYKPFRSFPSSISEADQQLLSQEAQAAIATCIVPAFHDLLEFFREEYLPAGYDNVGLWQSPVGREEYEFLAKQFTTTDLTPQEIHEIGLAEVQRIRMAMQEVIQQVKFDGSFQEFLEYLRTEPKFYYENASDLLEAYREVGTRIDPQLKKLFLRLPRTNYRVEAVPMHLAPDTTAAYYRPPAANGTRPGTYFVNLFRPDARPKYEIEVLSLHESVPGHHLQMALSQELEDLPNFRRFDGYRYTAFVEGWALYSESLGDELGLYKDPYSKFGQLTYEMWRAVRLVIDTGIHHFKWSRKRAINYFSENAAKTPLDIVNEVDRYITWPGQALSYQIGGMKIKELRARAAKSLGENFDIREFHDVVLRRGSLPLDLLESQVDLWLAEEGRSEDGL